MIVFAQIWKRVAQMKYSSACRLHICQAHVYLKLKCLSAPEVNTT